MSVLALDRVGRTRGRGVQRVPAVREVTLAVEPGEIVLLLGPSGSGKTTVLALAGGLLTPDVGAVCLAGVPLASLGGGARGALRARTVGLVLQRAGLLSHLTARDNVRLMARLGGLDDTTAMREADRLLEELGLADRRFHRPAELSGGEEMRVAVARALVHRPAIVLADEPTASLDGPAGREVAELLARAARVRGTGVLIATHDDRLGAIASRAVRLADGRLTGNGGSP